MERGVYDPWKLAESEIFNRLAEFIFTKSPHENSVK